MTPQNLIDMGVRADRANEWAPWIEAAMDKYEINTPRRQASFLAQILHESGMMRWLTELWGPTPAQSRYEGRIDLGNVQPGDGYKYLGRGLLQVTGRDNYRRMGAILGLDLEASPELLAEPAYAALSAAIFWDSHGLNTLADADDQLAICRRINGGKNGLAERVALYAAATEALA